MANVGFYKKAGELDDHHGFDLVGPSSVGIQQRYNGGEVKQKAIQAAGSSSAVLTDNEDDVIEVEELHGIVVLAQDGQFYVSLDAEIDSDDDEIDLGQFANIFVTVNAVDGVDSLVFDNTERPIESRTKQRRSIAGQGHGTAAQPPTEADWRSPTAQRISGNRHFSSIVWAVCDDNGTSSAVNIDEGTDGIEKGPLSAASPAPAVLDEDVAQEEVVQCEEDTTAVGEFVFKHHYSRRVFGGHRCFECGQTFVNMARLERHLSVHQQYGLYLCPLCNKTYKYEYNLFFHWRNTCSDMNALLSQEERKTIEINALRQLVEEIAHKKVTIGPLELGTTLPQSLRRNLPPILRQNAQPPQFKTLADKTLANKLTTANLFGHKLALCSLCELSVYEGHLPTHRAVHRGDRPVDGPSVGGAFFCDLCALAFRTRANLIRHWRSGCSTIHANLPPNSDFALDDVGLKQMVVDLLKKLTKRNKEPEALDDEIEQPSTSHECHIFNNTDNGTGSRQIQSVVPANALSSRCHGVQQRQQISSAKSPRLDEKWAQAEGIFFADDFLEEDITAPSAANADGDDGNATAGGGGPLLLLNADGRWLTMAETERDQQRRRCPNDVPQHHGAQAVWPKSAAELAEDGGVRHRFQCIQYTPQSVQCSECYRSFSSVQRLEKHMAGVHCSFGTHHCLLCGSRFKYEYNLLFHYRQVCPYTMKMVSKEARQQLEAVDLKKTVRRIAAIFTASHSSPHPYGTSVLMPSAAMQQQLTPSDGGIVPKIAHDNGTVSTPSSAPSVAVVASVAGEKDTFVPVASSSASHALSLSSAAVHNQPELGDSVIRRQMMKKIIQKHRCHQQGSSSSASTDLSPLPQQLLQPVVRPNLPDGTQCPICSIVFYGLKVLVRHLRAAHPNESSVWERTLSALGSSGGDSDAPHIAIPRRPIHSASSATFVGKEFGSNRLATQRKRKKIRDPSEDRPPQLELADSDNESIHLAT